MELHKRSTGIVIDFETGGLLFDKNPITEIGVLAIDFFDFKKLGEYSSLVKPYDDTLIYDKGAAEATGITREKCEKEGKECKIVWKEFLDFVSISQVSKGAKWKPIIIGHNIGFDIGFLLIQAELHKTDLSKYFDGFKTPKGEFVPFTFDTQRLSYVSLGNDKDLLNNKLGTVAAAFGVELFDAHRALADVHATADVFIEHGLRTRNSGKSTAGVADNRKIRKNFPL
jgi:DNA polymerase III epsilon subunit-like protein